MEYYSAVKRSETGSCVEMWMGLETVIQSKVSPEEENKTVLTVPAGPSLENAEGPSCVLHQRNASRAWHLPGISIAIGMVLFFPLNESHKKAEKLQRRDSNVAPTALRGDFLFLPVGLRRFSVTRPIWQSDKKKKKKKISSHGWIQKEASDPVRSIWGQQGSGKHAKSIGPGQKESISLN